jgi:hypothetical protein
MNEATGEELTVGGVLTEGRADDALRGALSEGDVATAIDRRLEIVPRWLRAFARDEVVGVAISAFDLPLISVLAAGWRKWDELTDAARRTLEMPGATEIIELRDERITSTHHPRIDVTLDREEIAHIDLGLELDIVMHAVTAVVCDGHLSALRTGRADVTARLSVEDQTLVEATRPVELPIEIGLGAGISLVDVPDIVVLPASPTDGPTAFRI